MIVLRQEIGDVLRDQRTQQGRTLRQVSSAARVSLGYLSEVERGQKEASSELLSSICGALDLPLSRVLGEVTRRVAETEDAGGLAVPRVPDTVPPELSRLPAGAVRSGGHPVRSGGHPVRSGSHPVAGGPRGALGRSKLVSSAA